MAQYATIWKLSRNIVITILITQCISRTDSTWINVANFKEEMITLRDQGLGTQSWQDYLDSLNYEDDIPNGGTLSSVHAQKIARKFNKQIDAIKKLKQTIEANFASFSTTSSSLPRCCMLTPLSYDARFLRGVDRTSACELISKTAISGGKLLNKVVVDAMKQNLKENPNMKWQYFGSTHGIMTIYPSNKAIECGAFDPRYRPWYVEAATPIIKEVVVVIDRSYSMRKPIEAPLMNIARGAATTVLESLASHDLIGVVGFSDKIETLPGCFSDSMAMASRNNVKQLKKFVEGLTPSGGTGYIEALQKAFSLLDSSANMSRTAGEHGNSEKVILFLTDGMADETSGAVKTELEKLQKGRTKPVIVMTYGFGIDLPDGAIALLKNMAKTSNGKFERIDKPSELRGSMASYYQIFVDKANPIQEAVFSIPYHDAFGLGIVTTVTLPVMYNSEMIGVLGIDVPLEDLFSDSVFNRHYVFVIDMSGRTWRHPLLPDPREGVIVSSNIQIENLERNEEAKSIIESMKKKETGSKAFNSYHLISIGDPFRDGVAEQNLASNYFWAPVPGFNLSLCLVMVKGDVEKEVADSSVKATAQFVYHRSDIVLPENACNHFQRVSTMQGGMKFSPECFIDPHNYLNGNETKETIDLMERYLLYKSERNPGFMADIRATAAMTAKANDIWVKKRSDIQKYIIWRYIGTYNGIVRFVPLAKVDKAYNPTLRPWYRRALSQPGKSVFSTPYEDAFGACFVVTLSHTLYLGNKEKKHKPGDTVIAVLGADFTLEYFYKLITDTFPKCRENGFSCYVIDNSGYIIIHRDFVEAKHATLPEMEYVHVAVKDSEFAKLLINGGYMTSRGCIDIRQMRDQVCWKLDLKGETVREFQEKYEISAVADSNVFIVVEKEGKAASPCSCSKKSIDSVDTYRCQAIGTCQCPCYKPTTYSSCEDRLYTNASTSYQTCAPKAPSLDVTPVTTEEKDKAATLKYCYQEVCSEKKTQSECFGILGCSWCQRNSTGATLKEPYCGSREKCYLGMEELACASGSDGGQVTTPNPHTDQGLSVGAIIGIAVGAVVLVVVIVVILLVVLHMRRVVTIKNPFAKKADQPVMKMTNAESTMGIDKPYDITEAATHFDPVNPDDVEFS